MMIMMMMVMMLMKIRMICHGNHNDDQGDDGGVANADVKPKWRCQRSCVIGAPSLVS